MAAELLWTRENGCLILKGELDQDWLVPLWEARAEVTQGIDSIDLSQVTRVDTAGLALLIHFVSDLREQGKNVTLRGKSENMQTLVQLYNLPEGMIP